MRYNNVEEYDELHRTFNTLKKIKSKNWTKSFKDRAISEYHNFRNHGIEVSDHFLSRFLNQDRNFLNLTIEDIVEILNYPIKYKENKKVGGYSLIRYEYYKGRFIRVISNATDQELISIIFNKNNQQKNKLTSGEWIENEN